jgi:hypothetical protein
MEKGNASERVAGEEVMNIEGELVILNISRSDGARTPCRCWFQNKLISCESWRVGHSNPNSQSYYASPAMPSVPDPA